MAESTPTVAIIMGSQSDWDTMRHAAETLGKLGIAHANRIISAHRTPQRLYDFASQAREQGYKVIIAAAGGAAGLPGVTAALTPLPVFGVPIESKALSMPFSAALSTGTPKTGSGVMKVFISWSGPRSGHIAT